MEYCKFSNLHRANIHIYLLIVLHCHDIIGRQVAYALNNNLDRQLKIANQNGHDVFTIYHYGSLKNFHIFYY